MSFRPDSPIVHAVTPSPPAEIWTRTSPIRGIAIHMAEGGGTVSWLTRADGNSSHYVIEYTGRLVQMVPEAKAAGSMNPRATRATDDKPFVYMGETIVYGATVLREVLGPDAGNPNGAAIAIEIEGFAGKGPNAAQVETLVGLVRDIRSRRGNLGTFGHRDQQSYKACPGKLIPWALLGGHGLPRDDAGQEETMEAPYVFEYPVYAKLEHGASLYIHSDLRPDPRNITSFDASASRFPGLGPGELWYAFTLAGGKVAAVAYEGPSPDSDTHSRAMFVRMDQVEYRKRWAPDQSAAARIAGFNEGIAAAVAAVGALKK